MNWSTQRSTLARSSAHAEQRAHVLVPEGAFHLEHALDADRLDEIEHALNAAVSRYNAGFETFPGVLFAGTPGFHAADFDRLDDSEKGTVDQVPQSRF